MIIRSVKSSCFCRPAKSYCHRIFTTWINTNSNSSKRYKTSNLHHHQHNNNILARISSKHKWNGSGEKALKVRQQRWQRWHQRPCMCQPRGASQNYGQWKYSVTIMTPMNGIIWINLWTNSIWPTLKPFFECKCPFTHNNCSVCVCVCKWRLCVDAKWWVGGRVYICVLYTVQCTTFKSLT